MIRVAFGHKIGVGKDSSCDYLVSKYGGIKFSFARPLYDIMNYAQTVCKFDFEKDRKFLRFIGTEWARNIDPDVWVNLLENHIKFNFIDNIFISDLRFKNEYKMLKKHGFKFVKINKKNFNKASSDHQSDVDLDNIIWWDYEIENNETLDRLHHKLDKFMCEF